MTTSPIFANLMLVITQLDIVKLFLPAACSFIIGILVTPLITHYMFKHELWKKKSISKTIDGRGAPLTAKLHNDEERKVPRMGGLVVLAGILLTAAIFRLLPVIFKDSATISQLNFISRGQTWLTLSALVAGGIIGVIEDLTDVGKIRMKFLSHLAGGLSLRLRVPLVGIIGLVIGAWMHYRMDISSIHVPYGGNITLGALMVLFAALVIVATYSCSVIDGVDGLSGGLFAAIYSFFAFVCFTQQRYDLAALCLVIVGSILAFLWFNIPPARFFLSESGTMPLTITIGVIALLTDTTLLLPLVALPIISAPATVMMQLASKKLRHGKKIFIVSPLHNHLQLKGWPKYKVTMRFWVVAQIVSFLAVIVFLTGGFLR